MTGCASGEPTGRRRTHRHRGRRGVKKCMQFVLWMVPVAAWLFAGGPGDWPQWRGPRADGVVDGGSLPVKWSRTENVRWSAQLPGWGTSSPVVYGGRLFVTTQAERGGKKSLLTICLDRRTGQELWRHDFGLGVEQRRVSALGQGAAHPPGLGQRQRRRPLGALFHGIHRDDPSAGTSEVDRRKFLGK